MMDFAKTTPTFQPSKPKKKLKLNMSEFAARLEETNKQKRENLEAKRAQRLNADG